MTATQKAEADEMNHSSQLRGTTVKVNGIPVHSYAVKQSLASGNLNQAAQYMVLAWIDLTAVNSPNDLAS